MQDYLNKAQHEISEHRAEIIDRLVQFSLTDMLLFWGQEKDLIERQQKFWEPILKWANNELNAKFATTNHLDVPDQDTQSGYRLKKFMQGLSDKELAAFYALALKTRSVLLAAAVVKGNLTGEQAFNAAFLEELWQAEHWGSEEEADNRRQNIKKEIMEIENFLHEPDVG